jgi:drug/metabolite transporter (DMT)-like permease
MTVVLARFVLQERIGRQRLAGLALGLVGLALIATR